MNEVDIAIFLIVGLSIYYGVAKGFFTGTLDLLSIPLALAAGSVGWKPLAGLFGAFGFPGPIAGLLGFLVLAIGIALGVIYLGAWLVRNLQPPRWLDRGGGGATGLFSGALLAALLMMISGVLAAPRAAVQQSFLGPQLIRLVPAGYEALERAGVALPKLVMLPTDYRDEVKGTRQGLQFLQINFSRLGGATCMDCRTPVKFLGYKFRKGTLLSPKFQCPKCGRTSDGCQTFEGFHAIYGRCPVDLAREGVRFDCGVWTNGNFIVPRGRCPIDGNILRR